jgi:predicted transglutaminase-like cysteine proteinase
MARYLISCSVAIPFALFATVAAAAPSAPQQQQQTQTPAEPPVSQRTLNAAAPVPAPAPASKHLTEQERAELRRQLEQFNRQYNAKGK